MSENPQRHRHADILIAIAEGKTVQFWREGQWFDFSAEYHASPLSLIGCEREWRVKPESKARTLYVYVKEADKQLPIEKAPGCFDPKEIIGGYATSHETSADNLKLVFDYDGLLCDAVFLKKPPQVAA